MAVSKPFGIEVPCTVREHREFLVEQDRCPECGGILDPIDHECRDCGEEFVEEAAGFYPEDDE